MRAKSEADDAFFEGSLSLRRLRGTSGIPKRPNLGENWYPYMVVLGLHASSTNKAAAFLSALLPSSAGRIST